MRRLKLVPSPPSAIQQGSNGLDPNKCIVSLYKEYNQKCPEDRPPGAFYLKPLVKPASDDCWFSSQAAGHNTLANTVGRLCQTAGVEGHFTNHSLRATAATRLFEAKVDEQLIMQRTGHSTTSGVRSYKRVGEKLKPVKSDILNRGDPIVSNAETNVAECYQTTTSTVCGISQKPKQGCNSVFALEGASNFTINFNFAKE